MSKPINPFREAVKKSEPFNPLREINRLKAKYSIQDGSPELVKIGEILKQDKDIHPCFEICFEKFDMNSEDATMFIESLASHIAEAEIRKLRFGWD